jgi:hypothetical protein
MIAVIFFRFFAPKMAAGKICENFTFFTICIATTSTSNTEKCCILLVFEAV